MAAGESALMVVTKARAEALVKDGVRGAERLLRIVQDPARCVNTSIFAQILLEVTAMVLVASVFFEHFGFGGLGIGLTIAIMVVVSFIVLGVAPRTLGRQYADQVGVLMAGPLSALAVVLGPVSTLMMWLGQRITPGQQVTDGLFTSEADLRELVDMAEASDLIEADERKMIQSVFDLDDTLVKEIMVPRAEMVYIEAHKTLRQGLSLALRSGFSRIPVIGEDIDDIVGILYLKDVIRRAYDHVSSQSSEKVESLMRPATFCPDLKPVDDLLRHMQQTRSHVVIVVDEYGGTAGLATIEDILEEIVGEIVDEYDDEEIAPIEPLTDGRYRVSSRLSPEDLGELFDIDVDEDELEVETVLGIMAKELNKVPIPGAVVEWQGLQLVAERASGRRHSIQTVLVEQLLAAEDDPSDAAVAATVASAKSANKKSQQSQGDRHE